MAEPWTFTGPVPSLGSGEGTVTLVEGPSFCLSGRSGDVQAGLPHGLFVLDTRVLSRFELRLDGQPLEPLGVAVTEPFAATFVGRGRPDAVHHDSDVVVLRRRHVGRGLREGLEVRNYGGPRSVELTLHVDADFAHLFEVKESRAARRGTHTGTEAPYGLVLGHELEGVTKQVAVTFSTPAAVGPGECTWQLELGRGDRWEACVEVAVTAHGTDVVPRFRCGVPDEHAPPARQLDRWRNAAPAVETDHPGLATAVARATEDLGALRIFDPTDPSRVAIAAGAPWFMTVFGRDSLLTAWMALIVEPELALGVLEILARFQGRRDDDRSEEQPGRILHEMRFGTAPGEALEGADVYYGSVDATPLFVMLLGELRRWGLGRDVVDRLLPHADAALAWVERYGDRDGDGFVEYLRTSDRGLANQGWKDSWDGVTYADGRVAEAPLALCEVQGYVYAAYVARAHFAREAGDRDAFEHWRTRARALKEEFNRRFWLPERRWFALALDAEKRPVDALASNMGHCLWTGIVDTDKAAAVADALVSPEMFSGWGIRTLASHMGAYNPVSYHNGSVWPHDTALAAAGLMRYGFTGAAHRVIEGMLDAAAATGGRLPELFSGLGRDELPVPAPYPTSCSPQAWAAAAPLLFLRTLLRLDPWVPAGRLWLAPALPAAMRRLRVANVPVGGARVAIDVVDGRVGLEGVPDGLEVVAAPRQPLSATFEP